MPQAIRNPKRSQTVKKVKKTKKIEVKVKKRAKSANTKVVSEV